MQLLDPAPPPRLIRPASMPRRAVKSAGLSVALVLSIGLHVGAAAVILWALSFIYVSFGTVPWIAAVFYGLKPAVLAIVAAAVIRIGKRALKNECLWSIAGLSFVVFYFFNAPFPLILAVAGVIAEVRRAVPAAENSCMRC